MGTSEIPETLVAHAALLDGEGVIVAVNEAWRRFGAENGLLAPNACLGTNYLALCRACLGDAHRLPTDLQALLSGRSAIVSWVYPCDTPQGRRWFNLVGVPRADGVPGALLAHVDLSPLVAQQDEDASGPVVATSLAALAPARAALSGIAFEEAPQSGLGAELAGLSARQAQVLALVRENRTNVEIAAALSISVGAVKKHVAALLRRFGVATRRDLRAHAPAHAPAYGRATR